MVYGESSLDQDSRLSSAPSRSCLSVLMHFESLVMEAGQAAETVNSFQFRIHLNYVEGMSCHQKDGACLIIIWSAIRGCCAGDLVFQDGRVSIPSVSLSRGGVGECTGAS